MELKSTIEFEVIKNEKPYRFYLPAGAPFGEAYDALFEMLEMIIKLSKEGAEKAAENKEKYLKPSDKDEKKADGFKKK